MVSGEGLFLNSVFGRIVRARRALAKPRDRGGGAAVQGRDDSTLARPGDTIAVARGSGTSSESARPRILLANWRDTGHPEGGGSERYVERIAEGLARRGYRVQLQCAAYPDAWPGEWRDGVRLRRRGNRFSVYLHALAAIHRARADVVIDVQNGLPFFSRLVARCPVIVLVHHVHRKQWISAFGRLLGAVGWWIESSLAPRLYRHCHYVTVSETTRHELAQLGIPSERCSIVPNGLDPPPTSDVARDRRPTLVAISRLVPHKRLEHAIDVLARLSPRWPNLRLEMVGRGPWHEVLRERAERLGVADRVVMHGWVDEATKHAVLARSWLHLCPSAKEGWGIVNMEAAAHGVPSVAYREAGGVTESIVDGETGLLADGFDEFVGHVAALLADDDLRARLATAAMRRSARFHWSHSVDSFASLVGESSGLGAPTADSHASSSPIAGSY